MITAANCHKKYTLKIGDLFLAPRANISIEEPKDWESSITLLDANSCAYCGGESIIDYREVILKLYYIGNGDLDTAWHLFDVTNAVLAAGCSTDQALLLTRSIRCETPRQWVVDKAWQRIVETQTQYICRSIVAAELHLQLRLYTGVQPPYLYSFAGPDIA